jgi:hypothetical protein
VTAAGSGRPGELTIEVDECGAGDMALGEVQRSGPATELPAHVQQHGHWAGGEQFDEGADRDQGRGEWRGEK